MMLRKRSLVVMSLVGLAWAYPALAAPIDIRPEPGGKRLLFVDGDDVRTEPGGKRLLFIDGPNIRTEPGGKRLFFIDGDILRPEPGGPILAYIDGRHVRTKPGGPEILYIDGKDIRPDHDGKRLYYVDGEVLNNQQLMAALSILRPDLIKSPAGGTATPPPETAPGKSDPPAPKPEAAATPANSPENKEFAGGTYSIAGFHSSDGTKRAGKVVVRKVGEVYVLDLQFANGPWQGIAVHQNGELWTALGPPNTIGLAVYKIDGATLTGTWMNATGDPKTFGSEALSGAPRFGGKYQVTAGKTPFTGAPYAGNLTIDALARKSLNGDADVCRLAWDLGGFKAQGVGFKIKNNLIAVSGTGADCAIARLKIDPAIQALSGDFYSNSKANGEYKLTREGK